MDIREQIMVRLLAIAGGIDGIATAKRNPPSIDDLKRPAIALLDADEAGDDNDPTPRNMPRRVGMMPQIFILTSREPESLGSEINGLRAKLMKAIITDAALQNLTLDGRGIRYEGCTTELGLGRSMQAAMSLAFTFTYVLRPDQL